MCIPTGLCESQLDGHRQLPSLVLTGLEPRGQNTDPFESLYPRLKRRRSWHGPYQGLVAFYVPSNHSSEMLMSFRSRLRNVRMQIRAHTRPPLLELGTSARPFWLGAADETASGKVNPLELDPAAVPGVAGVCTPLI